MEKIPLDFEQKGFVVLKSVIDRSALDLFAQYVLLRQDVDPEYFSKDDLADSYYADPLSESLLLHMQPMITRVSGKTLFPTYSYLRIYGQGDQLPEHTDRPACEISCSMNIGYKSTSIWPLCVRPSEKNIAIELDRGDALVYKGCDIPHSRAPFDGAYWIQVFLHYVDANGDKAHHKFDHRQKIGDPQNPLLSLFGSY